MIGTRRGRAGPGPSRRRVSIQADGQSNSLSLSLSLPTPTLSFTLSAAWSIFSLAVEAARSILPSRFSLLSSVRSPAASLVRPFASSILSVIFILSLCLPDRVPDDQHEKRE